ncbi:hypothetical protein [Trabulsiella odontotermitis]|uniref:hypothetical protein n=1 Tax=Trabulsiella odontotermitis TaxID=379893 RepID=UPI000F6149CF|nr:hypothetical protein [Trabulsiella odontotermitis]
MSDFLSAVGDVEVPAPVATPPAAPAGTVPPPPRMPSRPMVSEGSRPADGAGLRAENRRLRGELERMQARNAALRREMAEGAKKTADDRTNGSTAQREPQQLPSAQQAALKQLQDRLAAADARVKQLAAQNHDLSVAADQRSLMLTPEQQTQLKDLQAQVAGLTTERDRLIQQAGVLTAENDDYKKSQQAMQARQDEQSAALTSQMKNLTAERDELKKQAADLKVQVLSLTGLTDSLQAGQATLKAASAAAATQVATLVAERDALKRQASDVQAQQTALRSDLKTAQDQAGAGAVQVKALGDERDALKQQLATLQKSAQAREQTATAAQARVQTLTAEREQMQQQIAALTAKAGVAAGDAGASAAAQETLKALTEKVSGLTGQVTDLTAERDALQAKVAQGEQARGAEPPAPAAPVLTNDVSRQTYASGVVFAGNLKRTLSLQQDLGVKTDSGLLLAGLSDAVNGTVRLDDKGVSDSYQSLIKHLSVLEEGKYRDGEKQLEKLTAGATLVKRNRTMFFLQDKKGAGIIRPGDKVRFDLTESVVKGKTLRNNRGISATVNDQLPYMVSQALTLAGRGGNITVYCLASDVYPPEQIPEGVFAYSLLKYTFRVTDK